jgi:Uma2 family endonuclease
VCDLAPARPDRVKMPDGKVEVVSDDAEDRQRDFETKREEYAEAGIAEY